MTLVAAFSIEHVPVIVGDFLLFDKQLEKAHIFLPTKPELATEPAKKLGLRIVGFRKKVHRINERLVIGFTGRIDDGQAIVAKLFETYSDSAPSLKQLSDTLSQFNKNTKGITQVVGWTAPKRPVCFSWVSNNSDGAIKVPGVFGGTGGTPFKISLTNVGASGISPEIKTAVERAQFIGVSKACSVLLEELHIGSAKNLEAFYGFGAEIAYWNGAKFDYVPKTTLVFWNTRILQDSRFQLAPANVMAVYENRGDFSALQISRVGPSKDGDIEAKETWVNVIPPMHDQMPNLDPASVGRLNIQADFYFHAVTVTDERSGKFGILKLVTNKDGCSTFKCVQNAGKDLFEVNIRELSEMAHSMFDPLCP